MAAPMACMGKLDAGARRVVQGEDFVHYSPCDWHSLVSKKAEVISKNGKKHIGWIFTVDPVSQSIVLVEFPDKQRAVTEVIMGHAIHIVTLVSEPGPQCLDRLNKLFQSSHQSDKLSDEEISLRKADLKLWLEKHHIPVTLSGKKGELLSIAGALYIEPPYGLENCVSANEIILARVQTLIQSKPDTPKEARTCNGLNT